VRQFGALARRLEIRWIDVALALGLSFGIVLESGVRGSFPLVTLLTTLPLAVRRRWPIGVFSLTILGAALGGQATGFVALTGAMAAGVSMGIHARHRWLALLVLLVAATGIAIEYYSTSDSNSSLPIPGIVLPFFMMGAVYFAGNEIRSRQQLADAQTDRAQQLEVEREQAIRLAAETERRHIARELHDVVAHSVSVMVVQAGAARQVLTAKPDAARESLMAVEASGHEAMTELRRLLGVLGANGSEGPPLAPQPGITALAALIARVKDAGLPVELHTEGALPPLPPGVDVAAYRIVQEALTNALKYAGGAPTTVVIRYRPEAIELEILDEGTVATPADAIGRGLAGMRERVALFGGSIETGKRADRGFAVRARLPLEQPG
jgi:signal transduction histidine kinase